MKISTTFCTHKLFSRWPSGRNVNLHNFCRTQSNVPLTIKNSGCLHNQAGSHTNIKECLLRNFNDVNLNQGSKLLRKHFECKGFSTYTNIRMGVIYNHGNQGLLNNTCNNHMGTLSLRTLTKSTKEDEHFDEHTDKMKHRRMMQSLSNENDMLSRFRNSYIMTLVSLAALQYEASGAPCTIAALAIATSALNLTYGTYVYILNLRVLHKNDKISKSYLLGRLFFAVAHYFLWIMLLTFLFPEDEALDAEWKRISEK